MGLMRLYWILLLACLGWTDAAMPAYGEPHATAKLLLDASTAPAGSTVTAAVAVAIPPGWHLYWRNPGESGSPPGITWQLPEGVTAGPIEWPLPRRLSLAGLTLFVYSNDTTLLVPLTLASNLPQGPLEIRGSLRWLECSDKQCLGQRQDLAAHLEVGAEKRESPEAGAISVARSSLPHATPRIQATGRWETPPGAGPRSLRIEWVAPVHGSGHDFLPFESKDWSMAGASPATSGSGDRVTLLRTVEKFSGEWPSEIVGLGVATAGGQAAPSGYEGVVKIEGSPSPQAAAVTVTVTAAAPEAPSTAVAHSSPPPLARMILFAFLGGLILNVMPCVLPVISLKILGFVNQSAESPARVRFLGLMYAAGVLASFLVMAGLVIALKQAGRAVSWGIQFGNPQFLVVLTTLVLLVSLNLFGVFEVAIGAGAAGSAARREGAAGAFFNGVLAVVLATPCTAPYLGLSVGFAITQAPGIILLLFLTIGVGLAAPYVALAWHPAWLRALPRPGRWMEHFKVAMGFPMLMTTLWLFWLAGKHYADRTLWLGLFLVCTAAAAWVYGTFVQRGTARRGLALGAALLLVAGGAATALAGMRPETIEWKPWSPQAVAEGRAQGRPVVVDFTADWCAICNVNRRTSIEIPSVLAKLREINAVMLLADYTSTPDNITEELARWERGGVPLVLVYPRDSGKPAKVLPETLTPGIFLEALDAAK